MSMSILADVFFKELPLVRQQLDSFNNFLEHKLQMIVDEVGTIETNIEDYHVSLGRIIVDRPSVKETDGSITRLFPNEARLRNLTYAAPLRMEFKEVLDEIENLETLNIGMMPIMIKSKLCNLHGLNEKEVIKASEDPLDPGGYFIVNGSERVVVTIEDLAPNRILVEQEEKYKAKIEVAKVFSKHRGLRVLNLIERRKDGLIYASFPAVPGQVPLVVLLRALGIERDQEIVDAISDDPDIILSFLPNLEEFKEPYSQEDCIDYIGKRVAAGQMQEYRLRRAGQVVDQYLLPHLGTTPEDRKRKALYLSRMAEMAIELHLNKRIPDDKDHYSNKRLRLTGDLMEDLFRMAFLTLVKDVRYQLERINMRGREPAIRSAVRPDVLTDRMQHALATGNWVGGRSGVSQLLDRTNFTSALSHLRRVVSPLSRSQPHFEARDLHPTHWGKICPNETPEGPNCGLVKNFAIMSEVSTGSDEKAVEHMLFELGMEPIK